MFLSFSAIAFPRPLLRDVNGVWSVWSCCIQPPTHSPTKTWRMASCRHRYALQWMGKDLTQSGLPVKRNIPKTPKNTSFVVFGYYFYTNVFGHVFVWFFWYTSQLSHAPLGVHVKWKENANMRTMLVTILLYIYIIIITTAVQWRGCVNFGKGLFTWTPAHRWPKWV